MSELRSQSDDRATLERKIVQLEARNEQLQDKIERQENYMKRKLKIKDSSPMPADDMENEPPLSNEEGVGGFKTGRRSIESRPVSAGRQRPVPRTSTQMSGDVKYPIRR